jgi:phage gpG-like protein
MADVSEFSKIVQQHLDQLNDLVNNRMPVYAGRIAKSHFQDNFRQSGFINNGLQPWQPAKRQIGKGTQAGYGTLLSGRNHLFSSIQYIPHHAAVMITNPVPYAITHNEGFHGTEYVRPFTRKSRLASLSLKGRKSAKGGIVNVRGFSRHMNIPKRQFIGESTELTKKINDKFDEEIKKIIK